MLEGLFSDDNPVLNFLRRVADITILNFIFIITCIPVFTVGASLTALYYVSINAWAREDGYIFKMYFKSFKQNFKQATVLWLGFFVVLGALGIHNFYWLKSYNTTGIKLHQVFLIIGVVVMVNVLLVFAYVWPLLAKFDNTVPATLKNAATMVVLHIPETICLCVIPVCLVYLTYAVPIIRPFSVIFGFGFLGYMQALILRHVLKPYLGEDEHHMTPEEELDNIGLLSVLKDDSFEAVKAGPVQSGEDAQKHGELATAKEQAEETGGQIKPEVNAKKTECPEGDTDTVTD